LIAAIGVTLFLTTGLCEDFCGPLENWTRLVFFTLGSAVIILGVVEAERTGLIRAPRWLTYFGNASYAIYLVHFPALSIIAKIVKALQLDQLVPEMPLFFMHAIVSIGVGCLFHELVEHPLNMWSKRFFRTKKATSLVAATRVIDSEVRKAA
jgi:peptidoglycan/LPS O-acetylase OafA/YrhL